MSDAPLPGPLDEFLQQPPTSPERPEQRRALLQQTMGQVRRRHRIRRLKSYLMTAAALPIIYGLACLIGRGVEAFRELSDTMAKTAERGHAPEPPKVQAADKEKQPAPAKEQPPAVALEWRAFDAPRTQQTALYLEAGDHYVDEERDLSSAVRCYGQGLRAAPTVQIEADDNWLVTAMKLDELERRKEK